MPKFHRTKKAIEKVKSIHFMWFLSFIILYLIVWIVIEVRNPDTKGVQSQVKKMYFQAVRLVVPIRPAVDLAVPYHQQEHSLSCEIAALLMALQYKGVNVTESELLKQLSVADPGPRHRDNTWGDPNVGFVGNINGTMPNTGYGVYEKPIYDVATKYRTAKIIESGDLKDLITEVSNNNPVVVWGVIVGRTRDISWKTPEGKIIRAQLDEHARTLVGYTGTSDKPELMILLDPIYGKVRMPVAEFMKNWALLDKKAVVVY